MKNAPRQPLAFSIPLLCSALLLPLSLFSASSSADWAVETSASKVYFSSVKNAAITEVHHFSGLTGKVNETGEAEFVIDLTSVETNIPIRNERMQKMLFATEQFPTATIQTKLDPKTLAAMSAGSTLSLDLPVILNLHGKQKTLQTQVAVTALAGNKIRVSSIQPIVVSAADFDLAAGLQALQGIASLASIAPQVPVTFDLILVKQ